MLFGKRLFIHVTRFVPKNLSDLPSGSYQHRHVLSCTVVECRILPHQATLIIIVVVHMSKILSFINLIINTVMYLFNNTIINN